MQNRKKYNIFVIFSQIINDGITYIYYKARYIISGKDHKEVIYKTKKKN